MSGPISLRTRSFGPYRMLFHQPSFLLSLKFFGARLLHFFRVTVEELHSFVRTSSQTDLDNEWGGHSCERCLLMMIFNPSQALCVWIQLLAHKGWPLWADLTSAISPPHISHCSESSLLNKKSLVKVTLKRSSLDTNYSIL